MPTYQALRAVMNKTWSLPSESLQSSGQNVKQVIRVKFHRINAFSLPLEAPDDVPLPLYLNSFSATWPLTPSSPATPIVLLFIE